MTLELKSEAREETNQKSNKLEVQSDSKIPLKRMWHKVVIKTDVTQICNNCVVIIDWKIIKKSLEKREYHFFNFFPFEWSKMRS